MKQPVSLRLIVCSVLCLAFLIGAAILLPRTMRLVGDVRTEQARTPTPEPAWGSSVQQVTPDPSLPTVGPVLKNGAQGEAVWRLQERLRDLGYYTSVVDGQYGAATSGAVLRFQTINGLSEDGVAGAETLTVLYSDQARVNETPAPTLTPTPRPTDTPAPNKAAPGFRKDGLPVLVNREHTLAESYKPADPVNMTKYCDKKIVKIKASGIEGERVAVDALMEMLTAAQAEGIGNWQVSAGYRSAKTQRSLFNSKVQSYIDAGRTRSSATSAARKTVAEPGTSEHQLGLAFDMTVPGVSFKGTKQQKWLAAHCMEYGFVIRYTEEKERITGYTAEPWHIRYVGKEHAARMTAEGLCLEEYIDRYGSAE